MKSQLPGGSTSFPGDDYDLVTFFDCLHDMGDPAGAAKHVLRILTKKNGTCMIVEPFAHDRTEDNLNLIGRVFYAASIPKGKRSGIRYPSWRSKNRRNNKRGRIF